jgi:hypothetical protein
MTKILSFNLRIITMNCLMNFALVISRITAMETMIKNRSRRRHLFCKAVGIPVRIPFVHPVNDDKWNLYYEYW